MTIDFGKTAQDYSKYRAGFPEAFFERLTAFDLLVPYSHEAWRGRIRASAGVAASLSPAQVERFDTDLAHILAEQFADDPLAVPHRVFTVICIAPKK